MKLSFEIGNGLDPLTYIVEVEPEYTPSTEKRSAREIFQDEVKQ